jgi:hypothetical protein
MAQPYRGAGRNLRASGVDHGAPARRKPQVLGWGVGVRTHRWGTQCFSFGGYSNRAFADNIAKSGTLQHRRDRRARRIN